MGRERKPGKGGAAVAYITRRKAVARLQLSLPDFRRLCILKGIYPVEPKRKKKLNTGNSSNKTYYFLSDIQYLSHEPIIWKFWEFKIFMRRMTRAKGRRDYDVMKNIRENRPFYKVDHIVKERYPTFVDAVRDLDDALSMCCLYANFAKSVSLPLELIELSRRLSVEFMHYIIESRSLRKVFVTIKGYYYQAEVMGQTVTWVVPHQFVFGKIAEVDLRIMRTFTEFYITFMGFINFKLYSSFNLYYPPKLASSLSKEEQELLQGDEESEMMSEHLTAFSRPLLRDKTADQEDEVKTDDFDDVSDDTLSCVGLTYHQTAKLQKLFEGLKIYLNREVPRESLVFVLRCFGAQVSWDKSMYVGSTFDESDESITHQVVDRDVIPNKYMNRYYVQPQWVFDSINARLLLPVQDYFPGVALPPHLSPFVDEKDGDYVAPEKRRLVDMQSGVAVEEDEDEDEDEDDEEKEDEDEDEDEKVAEVKVEKVSGKRIVHQKKAEAEEPSGKRMKMQVKAGEVEKENVTKQAQSQSAEEKRLAVMMIPKKKKRLYDKIMFGKKRKVREVAKLTEKREAFDKEKGKNPAKSGKSKNKL